MTVEVALRLLSALAGTLLLLLPGLLAARAWAPRPASPGVAPDPVGRALVGLGWGFAVVPTLAFFLCLATGLRVSWGTLPLAALAGAALPAVALVRARGRGGLRLTGRGLRGALAPAAGPLVAAVVLGLVYLLKYDVRFAGADSCIYTAAYTAAGLRDPGTDLLRTSVENARLGNPGVMSAYLVPYGASGFRVLYGLLGVLLALGGWQIGRAVGGTARWGALGLVLLPLNPYVAAIPQLDENLLALALGVTVLPFVQARTTGWGLAGVFFGLAVLARHCLLPALPAMLVAAWRSPGRGRSVASLLGGFAAITAFENLHHVLALGSLFTFESLPQYPPLPYRLAGLEFTWRGLLNWPLHDTVVRTPHNPFPMLVAWPLHLADAFGSLLFSALLVGTVAIWRVAPAQAVFFALGSAVFLPGILVQESWDHLNKLGVLATVAGAFVAWCVAGLAWVLRRPRVGLPLLAGLALALPLTASALVAWRVPADGRYLALPAASPELPSRLEHDARRATDVGLLPDWGHVLAQGPLLAGVLPGLAWELSSPAPDLEPRPWGFVPGTLPPPGPPVTVELDLALDPLAGPRLAPTGQTADLDLTTRPGPVRLELPEVPWARGAVTLYAGAGPTLTALVVYLGPDDEASVPPGPERRGTGDARSWERRKIWGMMAGVPAPSASDGWRLQAPRTTLRLRVPAGALALGLEKNLRGGRMLQWRGAASAAGVELAGPWDLWHN